MKLPFISISRVSLLQVCCGAGLVLSPFSSSAEDIPKQEEISRQNSPIMFEDNFQSGQFRTWVISENDHIAGEANPAVYKIVDAPDLGKDRKAAHFLLMRAPNSYRTEIALRLSNRLHEPGYHERWYGERVFLPADWPVEDSDGETIVLQWHAIPGDFKPTFPNLAISIVNGDWFVSVSGGDAHAMQRPTRTKLAEPVKQGAWVAWVIHARWSPREDGLVEIWRDGNLVFSKTGPNVYGDIGVEYSPYFKTGIYHPVWHLETAERTAKFNQSKTSLTQFELYLTDLKIGNENAQYGDVAPHN